MHYHAYEFAHAMISPMRVGTNLLQRWADCRMNPVSVTPFGRSVSAACEVFEGLTRRYQKPAFGIEDVVIEGARVPVAERTVRRLPFCTLRHFERDPSAITGRDDPKVLIVAPLSGHYATLLRGTVQSMLPEHDTFISDWADARDVPLAQGPFDLDDYIDYVVGFLRYLGSDTHVIAVCQPAVPVLAAAALMAADDDPCQPASMTLIGGPIDPRRNPTVVNRQAEKRHIRWFERSVISRVPFPHAGFGRRVYPGFLQLSGFMSMNLDRHVDAHVELFNHLIEGDGDSVEQHKKFYEEYLAVMDLPAEYYLQTIKTVFHDHALPNGTMTHRGRPIDCRAIEKPTLMTVEGELDDICGVGQTRAAHDLCVNLAADRKIHYLQKGAGHYGVFNGSRWRAEIQPRIRDMIRARQAD